jgi:outer membrane protein assembly factor BamB
MLSTSSKNHQRPRWWPAIAIVVLAITAVAYIRLSDLPSRQEQIQRTGVVLLAAILFLLIWFFAFSRLPGKFRLVSFGVFVTLLGLGLTLFRLRGVSGDVLPLLEWRFARNPVEALPQNFAEPADTNSIKAPETPLRPAVKETPPNGSPVTTAKPAAISRAFSRDYPQFLGPHRDAKVHGIKLNREWSTTPPQRLWRQSIGAGWSSFAVAENLAITQEQRGPLEMVVAYELKSGRVKWSHSDSVAFVSAITGNGPRATPTIAQNRVYTLGATGLLNCFELKSGRRIWSKDILQDNEARLNEWGMSGSPLVFDSLVVVNAGGQNGKALVAYHKATGKRIWSEGNNRAAYSSPFVATLSGIPQILIFHQNNIVSHDPVSGKIFWEQKWPGGSECVAQPVPLPVDRLFISTGYGIGCKLFQIQRGDSAGWRVSLIWETNNLKAKFTNVIPRDGYIYGLDDGILVCLDLANGERKWKAGRYGHGQMIGVDDLLLIQAESGEVVLVEANSDAHHELSRFAALSGKTWNNPALAGDYLLVRNDREAACYQLPLESAAQ